jgi:F0F1-type ATP synthase assembly protein I
VIKRVRDFVPERTKSLGGWQRSCRWVAFPRMNENRRPSRHALLSVTDDGWSLTAEFFSAVLVWTFFGWLADRWLHTTPWLVAGGALLGFALGMYLMWHRLQRSNEN